MMTSQGELRETINFFILLETFNIIQAAFFFSLAFDIPKETSFFQVTAISFLNVPLFRLETTPFDVDSSQTVNSGIFDEIRINGERLSAYHPLNLRVDKRFYFSSSDLIIYFNMWDVSNRKNIFSYYWNTIDRKSNRVSGWGLLPVLGLEFEF